MKHCLLLVLCLLLPATLFAQPAATTAPATEALINGDIVFVPPAGWKLDGKTDNGRLAKFSRSDPLAALVVNVDPQPDVLDDSAAPKIGQLLCKKIRDNAAAGQFELLTQPKVETDDRFFLRIHHRFSHEAETADELQIYRVIGKNLVAVAVTVFTDTTEQAKPVFTDAENTLLSVRTARQQAVIAARTSAATPKTHPATRPTVLTQAKIRFSAPAGWDADTNDNPAGIVASYKDPSQGFNTIVISVRPLPPEAKTDPKLRDVLVDEIVEGEKAQFKFDGAQINGSPEKITDNRFLRKERTRYQKADSKIQVTARQLRIGDAVVSVAMVSLDANATDIDKLADEVALTVKPIR
jgi:hypothetical protein